MELDRNNAADLATFFAKRFPHPHQRRALVDEARMVFREPNSGGPFEAWALLITRAQEQRAVDRLSNAAAAQDAEDENLQAVCALLAGRPWPPQPRAGAPRGLALSVGAVALGVAAALALVLLPGDSTPAAAPEVATVSVAPQASGLRRSSPPPAAAQKAPPVAASETPPAPPAPPAAAAAPEAAAPEAAAPAPVPEEAPAAAPAPPAGTSAPPAPAPAPTAPATGTDAPPALPATQADDHGRCTTAAGGLVGYYYAGRSAPGAAGETITVDRTAFVRADYPDRHNRYNAKAAVRCSVIEGDQLTLTGAPIAVPGDAYWVPVYSGAVAPARVANN